jgi:integrase
MTASWRAANGSEECSASTIEPQRDLGRVSAHYGIERSVPRERRVAGGRLFVNPNTGGAWAETSLKRAWYKACEQVGVRVSLYTGTKHSTATELRRQGVPLDVIQKFCGHRDPRSTEVYAKLADQALVEAIRRPRMRSVGRSPSARS